MAAVSQLLKRSLDASLYHLSLDTGIAHPSLNTARRSKAYGPKTASPRPSALSLLHPLSSASALLLVARGWLLRALFSSPLPPPSPTSGAGFSFCFRPEQQCVCRVPPCSPSEHIPPRK